MNTEADDIRGRLGLIIPSSNTTAEPEFHRWLPDEITVHGAQLALESVSDDAARAAASTQRSVSFSRRRGSRSRQSTAGGSRRNWGSR